MKICHPDMFHRPVGLFTRAKTCALHVSFFFILFCNFVGIIFGFVVCLKSSCRERFCCFMGM